MLSRIAHVAKKFSIENIICSTAYLSQLNIKRDNRYHNYHSQLTFVVTNISQDTSSLLSLYYWEALIHVFSLKKYHIALIVLNRSCMKKNDGSRLLVYFVIRAVLWTLNHFYLKEQAATLTLMIVYRIWYRSFRYEIKLRSHEYLRTWGTKLVIYQETSLYGNLIFFCISNCIAQPNTFGSISFSISKIFKHYMYIRNRKWFWNHVGKMNDTVRSCISLTLWLHYVQYLIRKAARYLSRCSC